MIEFFVIEYVLKELNLRNIDVHNTAVHRKVHDEDLGDTYEFMLNKEPLGKNEGKSHRDC